jgi:hypothetical protein
VRFSGKGRTRVRAYFRAARCGPPQTIQKRALGARPRLGCEVLRAVPPAIPLSMLDEMVMLSIEGGDLGTMRRLCDAGARIDGDPDSEDIPLSHACWRGRVAIARELLERGAELTFRDGGSAIGAALHGSRHCHDPEGGPSMRPIDEIPREPYAELARMLLDAGATIPNRIGARGARATTLLAELGVDLLEAR